LVFKIQMMEQGRKLSFARLYSGKLKEGDEVVNSRVNQKDKVNRIFKLNAGKRDRVSEAQRGDLVGLIGLRNAVTGDTICSSDRLILLESIKAADPVISVAVEPQSSNDQVRLMEALNKIAEEDPTFKIKVDSDTGQTVISGMGELHLEVLSQRLHREFNLDCRVGKPQVVYRETTTKASEETGHFDRELSGVSYSVKAKVSVKPLARGAGYKAASALSSALLSSLNPKLVEAALETLRDGASSGPVFGYPLTDVELTLEALEVGEGLIPEPAVKAAVSQAMRRALSEGGPVLMEPIIRLEITTPDEFTGEIIGYLSSRLGRIEEMVGHSGGFKVITALVPLAEIFGYSTTVRSQTQGRGSFLMQFERFDIVERKSR
jgi:elongation factor G